jgi:L-lactate dehydrogenase complex protein LldE
LGAKAYELSEFLVRVLKVDLRGLGARFDGTVAYHQSCHMTRELGVRQEPLLLLEQIEGLQLKPLERAELCCGFGGTFSVKLPEVAVAMADDKLADIRATGADYLVGADSGCLMHLRGRMNRTGGGPEVLHLAQLLERATRPRKEGGR